MVKRYFNIPIFLPELACPHKCIFCNQSSISGVSKIPTPNEISAIIDSHLSTISSSNSDVCIAFFGGSFTALPVELQREYLNVANQFVGDHITGIRISTRPDYIDETILDMLKKNRVTHIELGAQSLHDEVLIKSGRGHSVVDVERASRLILDFNFVLGLQMMIGLPGDSFEKSINTAKSIVALGATETRIYPTLVIKDTPLEKLWKSGAYIPLSLNEAVDLSASLFSFFQSQNVKVLRTGLFPSEDLASDNGFLAGPFHSHFKELVMSKIWFNRLMDKGLVSGQKYKVTSNPKAINYLAGFQKSNLIQLNLMDISLKFKTNANLLMDEFYVDNW